MNQRTIYLFCTIYFFTLATIGCITTCAMTGDLDMIERTTASHSLASLVLAFIFIKDCFKSKKKEE